jgi:2-haloacid dehalogenase
MANSTKFDAVVFDLLTALLDSWTLWNEVAGSPENGMRWRRRYLDITYGCGAYRPYETLLQEAAIEADLMPALADALVARWHELAPWREVPAVLDQLAGHVPLAVVTNCSVHLGGIAARCAGGTVFRHVMTAEAAGFYKPRPEPYEAVLAVLGTAPERTLFVAGSASDVPGARAAGMPVFWHNRIGLPARDDTKPQFLEQSLEPLPGVVLAGA